MLELNKNQLPYNTEVIFNGFNTKEIYIIKETEKAFLMSVSKSVQKGTSNLREYKEFTFWCPKSVWFNDDNFNTIYSDGYLSETVYFNCPYYLIKN